MTDIMDYLSVGQEHAISLSALSAMLKITERALEKQILDARISGKLILSSNSGYFLPSDDDELKAYVIKRKSCIKTSAEALKPFIKALNGRG